MNPSDLSLVSGQHIQCSPSGLRIHGEMSFEEWSNLLRTIGSVKSAYHCILADHLNYGRKHFGDANVAAALEQEEFDLSDVNKATAIGQLSLDFRESKPLSSEHYFVLSKVDDPAKQAHWADIAKHHKLSALELKRSIEAGKILRQSEIQNESGSGSGINTIQGAVFKFQQWQREMGGTPKILTLPEKDRRDLLNLLSPAIELAAAIEESLG